MRFSLVIATLDRPYELGNFLEGLTRQSTTDFEVIVVDQCGSTLYDETIAHYSALFPVSHIRLDIRRARCEDAELTSLVLA